MFIQFGCRKSFAKRGGEYQDSPLNFFVSQCGNLNFVGNLLVFQKFRLSKTNYASEGNLTLFCRDIVCLTVAKIFIGEPSSAVFHKIYASEKE